MKTLSDLRTIVKESGKQYKIAVACANDEHALEALDQVVQEGLAAPILIGREADIRARMAELQISTKPYTFVEADTPEACAQAAAELAGSGQADLIMKGKIETTTLMRVLLKRENGLRTHRLLSHFSMIEIPTYHKIVGITDTALNLNPDLDAKRQIIENALESLGRLGIHNPKVAMLAAAETVNPKLQESVDAQELKEMNLRGEIPGCIIEGPISYDLAMKPDAAELKGYKSEVAGEPDLLVVPNLTAGSILGKCLTTSANTKAAGVIVGAKVPIVLISRSAPTDDKLYSLLMAAALA